MVEMVCQIVKTSFKAGKSTSEVLEMLAALKIGEIEG